jgi:putative ABC transport system ATP-binding protein
MSDITVEATNLHKSYLLGATAVGALRGVDLTVRRGEFVALMGPSGCGKTTLLNVIGAIDLPSRGAVKIEGVDLQGLSDDCLADLRRDRIGMVFQFYNLLPTLTARENVEVPMQFKGVRPEPRARAARTRRPEGPGGSQALRAVRRRAAAGVHRASPRQRTGTRAARRADR